MTSLERYVGSYVATKEPIPSDRRGISISAGTTLFVKEMCGDYHFHLTWPGSGGRGAASQVHYSKLMTDLF